MTLLEFELASERAGPAVESGARRPDVCHELDVVISSTSWFGARSVAVLLEFVSQALQMISLEQPTAAVREVEASLDRLHASLDLWSVSSSLASSDARMWESFLSAYLRIPERFAAVFRDTERTVSSPRSFFLKVFHDLASLEAIGELGGRLLMRLLSCGFQDDLCAILLHEDVTRSFSLLPLLCLDLSAVKRLNLLTRCLQAAEVAFSAAETVLWMRKAFVPACQGCEGDLLDELVRYSSPSSQTAGLLCSLFCWLDVECRQAEFLEAHFKLDKSGLRRNQPLKLKGQIALIFLSFLSESALKANSPLNTAIVEGISQRLYHAEPQVRLEGMVLAECFARIVTTEKPLHFDLDEEDKEVLEYRSISQMIRDVDRILHPGQAYVAYRFDRPAGHTKAADVADEYAHISVAPSVTAQPSPADSHLKAALKLRDREPHNSKVKRPRFIRDCMEYLRTEDPEKWEAAIEELPAVLSQSFEMEMREFGIQLFKALLCASDQFSLENFQKNRMDLLGTLLSRLPENALRILKVEFLGRSLNLGQKSEILTLVMAQVSAMLGPQRPASFIGDLCRQAELQDEFEHVLVPDAMTLAKLINIFYLPLLSELQSVQSKVFLTAHDFLLEKTILCAGMFIYASSILQCCQGI